MAPSVVYMSEALRLAQQGWYTTRPNPAVGCVLVKNQQIIARGWHQYPGGPHAEQVALSQVTPEQAAGSDCYVTLEPCGHQGRTGPCIESLIKANIASLHIATTDPNPITSGTGIKLAKQHGIPVTVGDHAEQAISLNPGFFSHHIRRRPWVRAKIAMTLDGRTAQADGCSQWITGPLARSRVQHWRAMSGAIVTGIGTALADDPRLTVRETGITDNTHFCPPLRVVMDRRQRLPATARLRSTGALLQCYSGPRQTNTDIPGLQVPNDDPWPTLWQYCYSHEIQTVLVEAGPTLLGHLLEQGQIDELIVHIAPKLLGSCAKPFACLEQVLPLNQPGEYTLVASEPFGDDVELRYQHQESRTCLMV